MAKQPTLYSNTTTISGTLTSNTVGSFGTISNYVPISNYVQPLTSYRFNTRLNLPLYEEIARQVASYEIDEVNKTVTMVWRQTIRREDYDAIKDFMTLGVVPTIDLQDSTGMTKFCVSFFGTKTISHKLRFDYANPGVAEHVITWSFEESKTSEG